MSDLTETTYQKAVQAVRSCVRPIGFYASGLPGGYEALWARDSMITALGASVVGGQFKDAFTKSIETLSENQSEHGQIPNAVGSWNEERQSDVTFNTIDSGLWYIIGHHVYAKAYEDKSLLEKYSGNIKKALTWLQYQDPNEDKLLVQLPTMDWQDAFPHRYGRTINTQALYYGVLKMSGREDEAEHIKKVVNGEIEKYLSLYGDKKGYYLPYVWKTHGPRYREQGEWFDTLGNLLAIISDLATPEIAQKIFDYIEKEEVAKPYPCRAINPPIKPGDKDWQDYYKDSDAGEAYSYLNGGVWPFVGGFYVAALVKTGRFERAEKELENLARANLLPKPLSAQGVKNLKTPGVESDKTDYHGFHEWIHGQSGRPGPNSNTYQAWSAGMYLFAHECVRRKKVPYF